ncbi:MAG: sulfide/dihydroorotate dehydrogenase-like FAD/NAD-binding protein [Candidatus Eisenbacteria bacterium]|uniref:Sulfide/dihydroorotate dehydrogenase-like FAD/NAD-binding protein n=1 Tax=Eiseniibacteriota bacterium TaxID=2212470 RepID=A0A948RYN5_UNCEI|nr:sulfide/dihydroorotate dehydrogenase-like FAD/NAD-binding protein [Candidatus Eisenbacteria bacterium]MBU1948893.1 sulfide/dihydroorotate dehydrogenase-like FAD/NAD-binding protein [Candidatus Eisenbacteria bacterium]MBU2691542.1 sulfide/dihydroorotate dehydrogenase-like FAD/NAD-binding protein [Candidatus Eisenbacteria bacterium]
MAYKVIERRMIVPNIHELVIEASAGGLVKPGQFVIVRPDEKGERIPLSVSDFDPTRGVVTCFFQEVGETTSKLALLKAGDTIPTFVGPLGEASEIAHFGTVLLIGGCFGIGSIYPIAKAMKAAGNTVHVLIEARSSFLLYWEDRFEELVDGFHVITRDGTKGYKGHISKLPQILKNEELKPDRVIVNGCTFLMKRASDMTRELQIHTMVNMNPIMIDGTGMCGVCRLTVGGQTKFACVDGPDFDGHLVDWKEFLMRRKTYYEEEVTPLRKSGVGTEFHLSGKHKHKCLEKN